VVFGIFTHKDKAHMPGNLPLFFKISLMRNMQQLDLRKVPSALMLIEDYSPKKQGHPKYPQIIVQVYALEDGHRGASCRRTRFRPEQTNQGLPERGARKCGRHQI
jgi:hypothetical protein